MKINIFNREICACALLVTNSLCAENSAEMEKIMRREKPDIVYHYCTLQGFLSIIQNASLWLSDISKSNDYLECIYIRDQIKDRIEKKIESDKEAIDAWNNGYEMNNDLFDSMLPYVVCFTEKKDCLSQWRGYADDGKGMAIGFSKSVLEELSKRKKYNLEFAKINYDKHKQKEYVDKIVQENLKRMGETGVFHAGVELNTNYKTGFSLYKHPSFAEEEEWRLVLNSYPYGHEMKIGNIIFSEPKYRVASEKLISYRELLFSGVKGEFIREIWIGPKADVEPQDIANVLRRYNYYDIEQGYSLKEPILIAKSLSSYR